MSFGVLVLCARWFGTDAKNLDRLLNFKFQISSFGIKLNYNDSCQ